MLIKEEFAVTDIQRALDKQTRLEAEATKGPWHLSSETDIETGLEGDERYCEWLGEITAKHEDATEYLSLLIQSCGLHRFAKPNAALIAHLRNQAALARAVIEAAAAIKQFVPCELRYNHDHCRACDLDGKIKAWADHVLNGETP